MKFVGPLTSGIARLNRTYVQFGEARAPLSPVKYAHASQ